MSASDTVTNLFLRLRNVSNPGTAVGKNVPV